MIQLRHVYKTFGSENHIFRNLDFSVKKGDFVFLTGESGVGKTTFFRMITGIEKPTSGEVTVNGHNLSLNRQGSLSQFRKSIGIVFQDFKLLPNNTVYENIGLPLYFSGYRELDIVPKVNNLLEKLGISYLRNKFPETLSGGEKQRVAIARALIHKPSILIADEPTGNLDSKMGSNILRVLEEANHSGTTVLVATHELSLIPKVKNSKWVEIKNCKIIEREVCLESNFKSSEFGSATL